MADAGDSAGVTGADPYALEDGDVLVVRRRPEVVEITLNRPDRLNALTSEMLARIYEVLEGLGRDPTCRDHRRGPGVLRRGRSS